MFPVSRPTTMPDLIEPNPYAPPESETAHVSYPACEVRGQYVLVESGTHLPQRCIKTNREVPLQQQVHKVFKWAPSFRPAWRYRRCVLTFYVRAEKQREVRRNRFAGWLLLFTGVAALLGGFAAGYGSLGNSGGILAMLGGIVLVSASRSLSYLQIVRFRDGRYWVTGCGREFRESLERA